MNEDELRARMAQVLQRLYGPSLGAALDWDSEPEKTRQMYLNDADAVIRELGLEPQCHYDPDCDYYRYVTDWIDPQTNQRVDLP